MGPEWPCNTLNRLIECAKSILLKVYAAFQNEFRKIPTPTLVKPTQDKNDSQKEGLFSWKKTELSYQLISKHTRGQKFKFVESFQQNSDFKISEKIATWKPWYKLTYQTTHPLVSAVPSSASLERHFWVQWAWATGRCDHGLVWTKHENYHFFTHTTK